MNDIHYYFMNQICILTGNLLSNSKCQSSDNGKLPAKNHLKIRSPAFKTAQYTVIEGTRSAGLIFLTHNGIIVHRGFNNSKRGRRKTCTKE